MVRRTGDYPAYDVLVTFPGSGALSAAGADASAPGVDQVAVYVDDVLVGRDYTASLVSGSHAQYEVTISPVALGWSRDTYFVDPGETAHQLKVTIADPAGAITQMIRQFGPVRENIPVDIALWTPFDDTTYETDETGVLPAGKTIQIAAEAIQYEWECEYVSFRGSDPYAMPPDCGDVAHQVSRVDYYVDGTLVGTTTAPAADYLYVLQWDAGGLALGDHTVLAIAVDTDGVSHASAIRTIHVVEGTPALDVDRTVTRHGNYYQVDLTLSLDPDAAGPARLKELVDYVDELIPVETETPTYTLEMEYSLWLGTAERRSRITVDFGTTSQDWIYLAPGNSHTVSYKAVPALYEDGEANPRIGVSDIDVTYLYEGETYTTSYDRYWQSLSSVQSALNAADYILVTNPPNLMDLYGDSSTANLLSSMARLATIRNGALGLLKTYTGSDENLRDLTQPGGYWAEALNPAFSTTLGGYMLIVGETEIVPAFNSWDMDVCWSIDGDDLHCYGGDNDIIAHDQWYANTSGDGAPELIVGRIVGNAAWQLDRPMIVSNNIYEGLAGYEYQAPGRALLVAGSNDNASTFADNISTIEMILNNGGDDDWLVEELILPSSYPGLAVQSGLSSGVSLLHLMGHGGPTSFEGALSTADPPDFYGFSPFVFAASCLTGKYESSNDTSLAESLFDHGASAYIGAVQVSPISVNDEMSAWFYSHNWDWETGESLGKAFSQLERDFYDEWAYYDWYRFWVKEYNFYGDPKLGASAPPVGGLALQAAPLAPVTSLHVQVPAYVVSTTVDGFDQVTIPGGRTLQDQGQPSVPYWAVTVDYAPGVRVQDVTLTARSGRSTPTGLVLPTTVMTYDADPLPDSGIIRPLDLVEDDEWFPALDEIYDWEVVQNPDGSSVLHVQVLPFHTQLATTNAEWYDDFTFAIDVLTSEVAIDALQLGNAPYDPGDVVQADVWLSKSGPAQDVILAPTVRSLNTGGVIEGLPLQALHDLAGPAQVEVEWDTGAIAPGLYLLWIDLYDGAGNWLDSASEMVEVGAAAAEITTLTASPEVFTPGDAVDVAVTLSNTGPTTVAGDLIVQVQTIGGLTVTAAYTHAVTSLAPGQQVVLEDTWQTTGIARGDYRVISYAKYAGRISEVATATLTTEQRIYLPLVVRAGP